MIESEPKLDGSGIDTFNALLVGVSLYRIDQPFESEVFWLRKHKVSEV